MGAELAGACRLVVRSRRSTEGFAAATWGHVQAVARSNCASRSLWTGSISFGLVNVPVRVYSAVHEHKLRFQLVHAKDDGPIGYEKVCKVEDKPVPNDEIVKAFEYAKGEFVQLTDEDFEAAKVEGQHTIDLEDFVPFEQIDPTFFAHAYLVGPEEGAERPYSLLVRARWRTPGSPASASSSCATVSTSAVCASATGSSRSSRCTSPTRSTRPRRFFRRSSRRSTSVSSRWQRS